MKISRTRVIFLPSETDGIFAQICRLFRLTRSFGTSRLFLIVLKNISGESRMVSGEASFDMITFLVGESEENT